MGVWAILCVPVHCALNRMGCVAGKPEPLNVCWGWAYWRDYRMKYSAEQLLLVSVQASSAVPAAPAVVQPGAAVES